jgi:hypothetical protein
LFWCGNLTLQKWHPFFNPFSKKAKLQGVSDSLALWERVGVRELHLKYNFRPLPELTPLG